MDASQFDRIAKVFAANRLSRRAAMRQGAAGLAAGALAAVGLGAAAPSRRPGRHPGGRSRR